VSYLEDFEKTLAEKCHQNEPPFCQAACPNGTIKITTETVTDEETGKPRRRLVKYEYDLGACMFCHLCVNACPHDAIRFDTAFEHAVYTRDKLVKTLNK